MRAYNLMVNNIIRSTILWKIIVDLIYNLHLKFTIKIKNYKREKFFFIALNHLN